jgi:hypothetical protein
LRFDFVSGNGIRDYGQIAGIVWVASPDKSTSLALLLPSPTKIDPLSTVAIALICD